jgi:tRNA(Ile)-lysidine synthase
MKEVIQYLNGLFETNDTVIVSCSGGPDSMCLLSLIVSLKDKFDLNIVCAHVNHHVRKESNDEEEFVKNYCDNHKIKFELLDIIEYKDNFHADARKKRYKYLDELMKKYKGKYLMTAHHGDDLMETILMRLGRGSNLKGYLGFRKETNYHDYKIIRPLITLTKEEIKNYDDKNNIPYAIDKTNFNDMYTRNRYRKYMLPLLKKEDKNINLKYLKYSEELQEYVDYVDDVIKEKCIIEKNKINLKKLRLENKFIQKKAISYYISLIQENEEFNVTDNNLMEMEKLINSNESNGMIDLPNNKVGIKEYTYFYIQDSKDEQIFDIEFNKHFENEFWVIETCVSTEDNSNYVFRINSNEIELPLHIRNKIDGDVIEVKNLNGNKKIKDIFIDEKIPRIKRDSWPIIVDNKNKVIGIPGIKKSQFCKDKIEKCDIIIKCKEK